MDSNIGFTNYNEIQVENKSKCRKITKHKFIFLSLFLFIIMVILIIILVYKNNQYNNKISELSKTENEIKVLNLKISKITNLKQEAESNFTSLINELSKIETEKDNIKKQYINLENAIDKLNYTKNDLLAKKEYITNQINYRKKGLNEDELKNEIQEMQKLLQKIKQRFEDLSINNSNIFKNMDNFESFTDTEVLNKCYDSEVYGLHVNRFHENCDGYPLLILIKTKNGQKIGAFTSKSNDGIKNIVDEKSIIINFDKNKYFINNSNEKCYVYCDIDQFPRFGNDLIIYRDGHCETNFPNCYNNGQNKKGDFIEQDIFDIDIMEIYRVKIKINQF